jgi:hypothetical protein
LTLSLRHARLPACALTLALLTLAHAAHTLTAFASALAATLATALPITLTTTLPGHALFAHCRLLF